MGQPGYISAYNDQYDMSPSGRASAATSAYDKSRQDYEDEVARSRLARDTAMGNADRTRSAADTALADYGKGAPPPLAGWKPSAMTEYQPSQLAQWMSSPGFATRAPVPGAGGSVARVGGAGTGAAVAPAATFRSANLESFDPTALESFDPSSYGTTFAKGAYGDFKTELGNELRNLTNTSVGAGRFNTGLFDEDQGRVVNQLGDSFNNKIAQQAGVFSGQRLTALQGGADLRYKRASDMDTNARSITELNATNAAAASRQAADLASNESIAFDRSAIDRGRLGLDAYGLETSRYGLGLDAASKADNLSYQRASDLDRLTYDQAKGLTDVGENRARTGLDAALGREGTYLNEYDRRSDAATSAASGQRDWAARDRELEDLRAEIAAIRQSQGQNKYGVADGRTGGGQAETIGQANQRMKQTYGL